LLLGVKQWFSNKDSPNSKESVVKLCLKKQNVAFVTFLEIIDFKIVLGGWHDLKKPFYILQSNKVCETMVQRILSQNIKLPFGLSNKFFLLLDIFCSKIVFITLIRGFTELKDFL